MAELTDAQLMARFTDGIKQARAAAKLLAFGRQSEHWLNIEKLLERIVRGADADPRTKRSVKGISLNG